MIRVSNAIRYVALLAGALSCNELTGPKLDAEPGVQTALSDGRNGGVAGFYFLPPLAPAVTYGGVFDPNRSPEVEICELTQNGCGNIIARFTRTTGAGSERVRVDTEAERYVVNWHTKSGNVVENGAYRIRVTINSVELGYADVVTTANGSSKRVSPSGTATVVLGSTLPIAFRIEGSALLLPRLTVQPVEAMPGARVVIEGFAITSADVSRHVLRIGGQVAPFLVDGTKIIASVPLFLGPDKWPVAPTEPVDISLSRDGSPVAIGERILRVRPLADAPGSVERFEGAVDSIAGSLSKLADEMPAIGREGQYLFAVTDGLDKLVHGPGELSLDAAIARLRTDDPASLRLLNALISSTGLAAALEAYAGWIATVAAPPENVIGFAASSAVRTNRPLTGNLLMSPGSMAASVVASDVVTEVTDFGLSRRMQLYEVIKLFGQTVVEETGTEFAETVGLAAGVIGIAGCVPSVTIPTTIISTVLSVLNWGVNKLLVGFLPSDLIRFELSVADPTLRPAEITDANLSIGAINTPPSIGVQDVIDAMSTASGVYGLVGGCNRIQEFKEALENTFKFFLDMIRAGLAAYTAAHPEANLDVPLFTFVPQQAWNARGLSAKLTQPLTQTPNVIAAEPLEVNWRASETNVGQGRIYATPATGPDALTIALPGGIEYADGAFGNDFPESNVVQVEVIPLVALSVDFPLTLAEDENGVITIRAGYLDANDQPIYVPGISLTLAASGGFVQATSGVTGPGGTFTTLARIAPTSTRIDITVTASANGEQRQVIVSAVKSSVPPVVPPGTRVAFRNNETYPSGAGVTVTAINEAEASSPCNKEFQEVAVSPITTIVPLQECIVTGARSSSSLTRSVSADALPFAISATIPAAASTDGGATGSRTLARVNNSAVFVFEVIGSPVRYQLSGTLQVTGYQNDDWLVFARTEVASTVTGAVIESRYAGRFPQLPQGQLSEALNRTGVLQPGIYRLMVGSQIGFSIFGNSFTTQARAGTALADVTLTLTEP
ncbi:MAG TPA: hypothetical protein VM939_03020 [Gemmatimonadaceae bacterium]|nr:hypothetical protein [Gemmatimonadaceae bacterium]